MANKNYIKISLIDAEKIWENLDYLNQYSAPAMHEEVESLCKTLLHAIQETQAIGRTKCFNCKKMFIPSAILTFQVDGKHFCSSACMNPHLPGPQD